MSYSSRVRQTPSYTYQLTLANASLNNESGFQLTVTVGGSQALAAEPVLTLSAFISQGTMEALTGRTYLSTQTFLRNYPGKFDINKMSIWR